MTPSFTVHTIITPFTIHTIIRSIHTTFSPFADHITPLYTLHSSRQDSNTHSSHHYFTVQTIVHTIAPQFAQSFHRSQIRQSLHYSQFTVHRSHQHSTNHISHHSPIGTQFIQSLHSSQLTIHAIAPVSTVTNHTLLRHSHHCIIHGSLNHSTIHRTHTKHSTVHTITPVCERCTPPPPSHPRTLCRLRPDLSQTPCDGPTDSAHEPLLLAPCGGGAVWTDDESAAAPRLGASASHVEETASVTPSH